MSENRKNDPLSPVLDSVQDFLSRSISSLKLLNFLAAVLAFYLLFALLALFLGNEGKTWGESLGTFGDFFGALNAIFTSLALIFTAVAVLQGQQALSHSKESTKLEHGYKVIDIAIRNLSHFRFTEKVPVPGEGRREEQQRVGNEAVEAALREINRRHRIFIRAERTGGEDQRMPLFKYVLLY